MQLFLKGQESYIKKLWNGEYFRYDTESEYSRQHPGRPTGGTVVCEHDWPRRFGPAARCNGARCKKYSTLT